MDHVLRLGRVLGSGLRLVGGYRAAAAVGFVLSVGWFVLGLDRADAATIGPEPDLYRESYVDRVALDLGHGLLWALGAVFIWAVVCWAVVAGGLLGVAVGRRVLRHRRDAVCDPVGLGSVRGGGAGAGVPAVLRGGSGRVDLGSP